MFRARERGMSFWPFAISLLLLVIFIVMWFSVAGERDQAKQVAARAVEQKAEAEKKLQETIGVYQKASGEVGFLAGGNITDYDTVMAQKKEYAAKLRDASTIEFSTKRYTPSPDGGIAVTEGDKIKVQYLTDAELADTPTLQSYLSKFETAFKRMQTDILRAYAERGQAMEDLEKARATYTSTLSEKDSRISTLTTEKGALENAAKEKENELNEKIADANRQKEQKEAELTAAQKTASENEQKLIAQANELQGQVRTLTQREAPVTTEGPDGEVIIAADGMAIVDRGRKHWLMPGTVFDVYGRAKGGQIYKKGSLKVTSTDDETSRAAVLEELRTNDPIGKGDLIQSLTYSPNRKLHFVLVGEFKKMGRGQAEAVLKNLGAVVDGKVTSETNYVVVGAGDNLEESDAVKAAKDLGIRLITEEQLGTFTRY